MINTASMLGLGSQQARKDLNGINTQLKSLLGWKKREYEQEKNFAKNEKEKRKRETQDYQALQRQRFENYKKYTQNILEPDSDAGFLEMLLGGGVIIGGLVMVAKFVTDWIKKVVGDIVDWIADKVEDSGIWWSKEVAEWMRKEWGSARHAAEEGVDTANTGADPEEDIDDGGVEEMEPVDENFKGLPGDPGAILREEAGYSVGRGRNHMGRDIAALGGTPLTPIAPAKITAKGYDGGYGYYVVYKTGAGEHLYAHMRKGSPKNIGDKVKPGDIIGHVGTTGTSTGDHLHWEFDPRMGAVGYKLGPKRDKIIDPVRDMGYKFTAPFTGLARQKGGGVGTSQAQSPTLVGNYKTAYNSIKSSFPEAGPHHIAAAIGNFDTEAPGLKPDTYQMNDGPGRGIAQWEIDTEKKLNKGIPGRWEYAEKKYGKGVIKSLPQQLQYFAHEMKTGNPTMAETRKGRKIKGGLPLLPRGRNAPKMWLGAKDLESATKGFMLGYEAPGKPHWPKRLKAAQGVHRAILKQPVPNPFRNKPIGKQAGGNVSPRTMTTTYKDLEQKYDDQFFSRQSKKSSAPVVIINTTRGGSAPQIPTESYSAPRVGAAGAALSPAVIAENISRYLRGMKA